MILSHSGKKPTIDPTAYIAPTATVCGDILIGAHCRIMCGACLVAEGGSIEIGTHCIVLENAVIRSTSRHSTRIGNHCLVGRNAHIAGCTIKNEVFIATGAAVFHGAVLDARSEVRVNGVVHLKTRLPEEATVPIGWDRRGRSGINSAAGSARRDLENPRTTQLSLCCLRLRSK